MGVHQKATLSALEGDVGWTACHIHRHLEMFKMWNRLINMNDAQLTKRIFNYDYVYGNSWCKEIKDLFSKVDEENVYVEYNCL